MSQVVFLRGVNVGGRNVFRPAKLVADLARLDVVNVGAAGTFVVRANASAAAVRAAILGELPFEPRMSIHRGADVLRLVDADPFAREKASKNLRRWVAPLDAKPKTIPPLPIAVPAKGAWSVRFDRVESGFALGLIRIPQRKGFVFPTDVVEDALGVGATTRWWETLLKIAAILRGPPRAG